MFIYDVFIFVGFFFFIIDFTNVVFASFFFYARAYARFASVASVCVLCFFCLNMFGCE